MGAPVLAEIARERTGSLTVRKVNSDENPQAARDYRVMSLATLTVFRDGEPVHVIVGARAKAKLDDVLGG